LPGLLFADDDGLKTSFDLNWANVVVNLDLLQTLFGC
jgi:hypothetical protein